MSSTVLSVEGLTLTVGGKALVEDVSFHLAAGEMMGLVGLNVDGPPHEAPAPAAAAEIVEAYDKASRSLLSEIKANWTDDREESRNAFRGFSGET